MGDRWGPKVMIVLRAGAAACRRQERTSRGWSLRRVGSASGARWRSRGAAVGETRAATSKRRARGGGAAIARQRFVGWRLLTGSPVPPPAGRGDGYGKRHGERGRASQRPGSRGA